GSERGILYIHIHPVSLEVPLFKILHHRVFPKDRCPRPVVQINRFLFIPAALIYIFFPVSYTQNYFFPAFCSRYRCHVGIARSSGEDSCETRTSGKDHRKRSCQCQTGRCHPERTVSPVITFS